MAALTAPELQQQFRDAGAIAQPLPPDALARRMRGDIDKWAKVIERMGIPQQ
jgi:tripartite-type tricarboxylate transporter receptor subunit TctC